MSHPPPQAPNRSPGWRHELEVALGQPELAEVATDSEPARRAAYWLSVVLGHCRLRDLDLGELDGSVPLPLALSAARSLARFLERQIDDVRRLEERLAEAEGDVEACDLCFTALEVRMEFWAALVAIDEAYQVCVEDR